MIVNNASKLNCVHWHELATLLPPGGAALFTRVWEISHHAFSGTFQCQVKGFKGFSTDSTTFVRVDLLLKDNF